VKSAAAQAVDTLQLSGDGVVGDRVWAAIADDATVVSAKHPRKGGRLLEVLTSYDDASGSVTVTIPGQAARCAGDEKLDVALSDWLGRSVALTDVVPDGLRLHRLWPGEEGMLPEWVSGAHAGDEVLTEVAGAARGRFVDYGPLHLVTTGQLARLEAELGHPVNPVRFRPNLLLDLPDDPSGGQRLRIGEVEVTVDQPTSRCVIPSLPQAGFAKTGSDIGTDSQILKELARHHREPVGDRGKAAVFGCYANVLRPGAVSRGDEVSFA
jgi:uncharacterized protein YcbX